MPKIRESVEDIKDRIIVVAIVSLGVSVVVIRALKCYLKDKMRKK